VTGVSPRDDRQARFLRLAALVHEPVRRYALRRVEAADVDDIVAETLLVLWRRLDDVPAGAELPWCYNVAGNCVANLRRSAARRERLVLRLAAEPPVPDEKPAPDDEPDVDAALAALPAKDREVVLLWAWEGLAPREIAVALGTSANAVSLRLTRAKRRLKAHLARQDSHGRGQKTGVSGRETR
jgi:RNA polymerase sigma-70 factor, ECF subfamily